MDRHEIDVETSQRNQYQGKATDIPGKMFRLVRSPDRASNNSAMVFSRNCKTVYQYIDEPVGELVLTQSELRDPSTLFYNDSRNRIACDAEVVTPNGTKFDTTRDHAVPWDDHLSVKLIDGDDETDKYLEINVDEFVTTCEEEAELEKQLVAEFISLTKEDATLEKQVAPQRHARELFTCIINSVTRPMTFSQDIPSSDGSSSLKLLPRQHRPSKNVCVGYQRMVD